MNAHIARSMDSASAIAIQTSTSQTISADIIPFPAKACQAEAAPVEVIEELPAVAAHNDNAVAALPPVNPEYGASALIRSEEHTSELQSLMRISYAVFCLKKNKIRNTQTRRKHT